MTNETDTETIRYRLVKKRTGRIFDGLTENVRLLIVGQHLLVLSFLE